MEVRKHEFYIQTIKISRSMSTTATGQRHLYFLSNGYWFVEVREGYSPKLATAVKICKSQRRVLLPSDCGIKVKGSRVIFVGVGGAGGLCMLFVEAEASG